MDKDKIMGAQLRQLREKAGMSRPKLAGLVKAHPNQIQKLESGERELTVAWLDRIGPHLNFTAAEFVDAIPDANTPPKRDVPQGPQGTTPVPAFDIRAAGGAGAFPGREDEPLHYLYFREQWIRRLSRHPDHLVVLEVSGDSMWETLHDGDNALVDRSQTNPRREGLYVIRIDDVLQVKRISMHPVTKMLTIKSDNPAYPTYADVNPDDIAVVGRVVWIGRSLG